MNLSGAVKRLVRESLKVAADTVQATPSTQRAKRRADQRARNEARRTAVGGSEPTRRPYPGDFEGMPEIVWEGSADGKPDPGEIVWTWVPFQEDHKRGKDRPVLLIGRDGPWLLALQLTSKDHDLDAHQEASEGRYWVDIGTGAWDRRGRESEVGVHRIIRVDPAAIRRDGAILDKKRFGEVADTLRENRQG
ncbi:type II toxin-antitoxin system PemK/MazF family toxin [Kribbia dieselivorans]|uniref:type II toxin-antitoxin system PemK/MazF family toxin n=1 Tax=Kribbia dieselivorans TaxID=331526 RepID=UPI0009F8842D|nr:type II toxin-antitoxin system PemK/MazF family toxin [Kribbia dieselivorans]